MKKFNHVIVRRPCKAMVDGITSAPELGKPDYELALKEHDAYIEALKQCDVDVTVLEADERYPDSCFVEDPALITRKCAIITNPGAASRNGEKDEIIGENYLRSSKFRASGFDGFMQDNVALDRDRVLRLPPDIDRTVAAFTEIVTVSVQALHRF